MTVAAAALALYALSNISPLTLPGNASLELWLHAEAGTTLASTLLSSPGATGPLTISGSLTQPIALYLDLPTGGTVGVGTYRASIDGGNTFFQSGTTSSTILLTQIGITVAMPAGIYRALDTYTGVITQWDNQTPKTRTFTGDAAISHQPVVAYRAQNNHSVMRSSGTNAQHLIDQTSNLATTLGTGNDTVSTFILACRTATAAPTGPLGFFALNNTTDINPVYALEIRDSTNLYRSLKVDNAALAATVDAGALDTNFHVLRMVQHGTTVDLFRDGVSLFTGSAQNVAVCTFNSMSLFCLARGVTTGGSNGIAGDIGEIVAYSAALSDADCRAVEGYLKLKWGTP